MQRKRRSYAHLGEAIQIEPHKMLVTGACCRSQRSARSRKLLGRTAPKVTSVRFHQRAPQAATARFASSRCILINVKFVGLGVCFQLLSITHPKPVRQVAAKQLPELRDILDKSGAKPFLGLFGKPSVGRRSHVPAKQAFAQLEHFARRRRRLGFGLGNHPLPIFSARKHAPRNGWPLEQPLEPAEPIALRGSLG